MTYAREADAAVKAATRESVLKRMIEELVTAESARSLGLWSVGSAECRRSSAALYINILL